LSLFQFRQKIEAHFVVIGVVDSLVVGAATGGRRAHEPPPPPPIAMAFQKKLELEKAQPPPSPLMAAAFGGGLWRRGQMVG